MRLTDVDGVLQMEEPHTIGQAVGLLRKEQICRKASGSLGAEQQQSAVCPCGMCG